MASYRPVSNSELFDAEQEFIAKTYLPLTAAESPPDAVQAVVDCIQVYGWRVFQAILTATSIETRGRLLAALVSGLPQELLEVFRGMVGEAIALWGRVTLELGLKSAMLTAEATAPPALELGLF